MSDLKPRGQIGHTTRSPEFMQLRRERIATACLQGLLAHPGLRIDERILAGSAVACADALIAELDKTEGGGD